MQILNQKITPETLYLDSFYRLDIKKASARTIIISALNMRII